MHILTGLIVGSVLGIIAGFAAIQYAAPPSITLQANEAPALRIPADRTWDI